jgi:TRAP-type C4-dicarboxylate transport system permease small subunit
MFKIFDVIDKAALWISVTALLFITIMTCISVLGRYFFAAPIPDDLVMSEFTMVIVAFLPLAAVQAAREHVFVTIFSDWLPNRPKVAMELFGVYLGAFTFIIVTCAVYTDFKQAFDIGAYEEGSLEIPEAPFRFIVFLGLLLFSIRLVLDAIISTKGFFTGEAQATMSEEDRALEIEIK